MTDSEFTITDEFSEFYHCSDSELSFEEQHPVFSEVGGEMSRYTDSCEIGRGGMKIVYRVFDNKSGRYVAMAKPREDATAEHYESFLREARLTACLQHPNSIPVYDIDISDDIPFFTMELKTGKSLGEMLTAVDVCPCSSMLVNNCLEIFLKICDAIAYAHSRGIIHLDLKPDNIQVGEYGEVIVCDWGLGKVVGLPDDECSATCLDADMLSAVTLDGEIKGTPGYMAPEQIPPVGEKTFQTDIYALGMLLFALVAGKKIGAGSVNDIFDKTKKGEMLGNSSGSLLAPVPASLRSVIIKATALNPEERYADVGLLRQDIQQYISGYPTDAEQAGFGKQLMLLLKRNRRISATLFMAASIIFSIAGYSFYKISASERVTRGALFTAERERDNAEDALQKYMTEKRFSTELGKSFEQSVSALSLYFRASGIYSDRTTVNDYWRVIGELNNVLEKSPQNPEAIYGKGKLLLIMQRFDEAAACYQINPENGEATIELVEQFAASYPGSDLKEVNVIVDFIREVSASYSNRKPLTEKMMAYDSLVRRDLNNHSLIVREVVQVFNNRWNNAVFDFRPDKRSLTIGGRHLTSFISDIGHTSRSNLLRTLKLDTLIIQSPDFTDLSNVAMLQLTTLDISDTNVTAVPKPHFLKLITEIICRPGQFSQQELKKFPAHITIIEN